jgi:hypothetical protein
MCKKSSNNNRTSFTFEYTTNINQIECIDGSNAYKAIYIDILISGNRRIKRVAEYNLNGSGSKVFYSDGRYEAQYCSPNCTELEKNFYQIGEEYEYRVYIVCDCTPGQCGAGFDWIHDGTTDPVKLIDSGTFTLKKKPEDNVFTFNWTY